MFDFNDNYDDIVFLDSEIEDDDDTAPVGILIHNVDGKAAPVEDEPAPAAAEEPAVVEPVAEETVLPEAVEEKPVEEAPVREPVAEEPAPVEDEPVPESSLAPELVMPIFIPDYNPAPVQESAAEPVAEESAPAPVEEEPAPAPVEEKKAPAKKKAAPKKPAARTTIQKPADDGNVWGNAVISTPAKAKKEPVEEKPEEKPAEVDSAEDKAPVKEEDEMLKAKSKAKSDDDTKKKAADKKPTEKKTAATKAAPKKENAKVAEKKAPAKAAAAKPAAKAAPKKEETKPAKVEEQVIEEGDPNTNHGRFVIKKTDKGNFVYKLYSYNYRVVAIGAEQYSSIASCKGGIMSVLNNAADAPIEDQTLQKWEEKKCPKWQIYNDKKGEVRLRLIASNGNIVATTNDGYLSKDAAKKGITAIARAAKGASIVRNDDLW